MYKVGTTFEERKQQVFDLFIAASGQPVVRQAKLDSMPVDEFVRELRQFNKDSRQKRFRIR